MGKKVLFILILTFLLTGCMGPSGIEQNKPEITAASATAAPAVTALGSLDDLVNQLKASGAVVETAGPIDQPFFRVSGQKIMVNGSEVQVFPYESEEARLADSSQISKDGSSIGTSMVSWMEPPHFWAKERLIALYVGKNQAVVESIDKVMGPAITQP